MTTSVRILQLSVKHLQREAETIDKSALWSTADDMAGGVVTEGLLMLDTSSCVEDGAVLLSHKVSDISFNSSMLSASVCTNNEPEHADNHAAGMSSAGTQE